MKIFLSLILIIVSQNLYAICRFKTEIKKVVSLSGPMTVLLNETSLINDRAFDGISIFNPVSEKTYKKKIYPGGIFLAHSALEGLSNGVVFYDESREVKRILEYRKDIKSIQIKTRGLMPLEVIDSLIQELSIFVTDCSGSFSKIRLKAEKLQEKLIETLPKNLEVVFYLGEFKSNRPPELIIVQDGVVKLLLNKNIIKTYPSDLSYINWSSKILSHMSAHTLHVGVVDSAMKDMREVKKNQGNMTIVYPGALVPGLSQLEAFLFWAQHLNSKQTGPKF